MVNIAWKRGIAAAIGLAALITTAGCSAGAPTAPASSGAADAGAAGLAKAQEQVKKYEAITAKYPIPTTPVTGVSALAKRPIYYIPLIQFIPTFVVAANAMKEAAAAAGTTVQVCNGDASPTTVASCVQQAIAANAAGIVTDAIPYEMAPNAFDAAQAAKVPVIIGDQYPPAGHKDTKTLSYIEGPVDMPSQIAWWIIADSGGKANAILQGEKDSPSSWQFFQDALPIYSDNCPGCNITSKEITASTPDLLASAVASNILAKPGVKYYFTEFADSLAGTIQGVQQSAATGIGVQVAAVTIDGLTMLKKGGPVTAAVAADAPYEGWAFVDQALRMASGADPVPHVIPSRLFTKDNIGTITLTDAAQASGEWFGDSSFKDAFKQLWK